MKPDVFWVSWERTRPILLQTQIHLNLLKTPHIDLVMVLFIRLAIAFYIEISGVLVGPWFN